MDMRCRICNNPIDPTMRLCPFCETTLRPEAPDFVSRSGEGMKRAGFSGAVMEDGGPGPRVTASSGTAHCLRCGCDYDPACAACPSCGYAKPTAAKKSAPPPDADKTVYAGGDSGFYSGSHYSGGAPRGSVPPYGAAPPPPNVYGGYGAGIPSGSNPYPSYPPYPAQTPSPKKGFLHKDVTTMNPVAVILLGLGILAAPFALIAIIANIVA